MKQSSLLDSFLKRQGTGKKQSENTKRTSSKEDVPEKGQFVDPSGQKNQVRRRMNIDSDEESEEVKNKIETMKFNEESEDQAKNKNKSSAKKKKQVQPTLGSSKVDKKSGRIAVEEDEDEFAQFTDATPVWARRESCKDAEKRTPGDPKYDPTTLYIPDEAWGKLTAPMKQYWKIKMTNFDKVILFKLGKFYELFYDDAAVGNKYLNLKYMGTKMHTGFPEKTVNKYTKELVSLGFKTVVVEQMETPEQMNDRIAREKKQGRKSEKTLNREITQILTKGTVTIEEEDDTVYLPNYLISVRVYGEVYGFSLLEIGTNEILMGIVDSFEKLKTILYQTRPVEAVYDPDNIPDDVLKLMRESFLQMQMSKVVNKNNLWHPLTSICELERLEKEEILRKPKIMEVIDKFAQVNKNLLNSTLSGMFQYLKSVFKFDYVIKAVKFAFYQKDEHAKNMVLDSQALQHLELFETSEGTKGSLFQVIDRTKTKFGRRLLRRWMMSPLMNTFHIGQRHNAVEDLQQHSFERDQVAGVLRKLPDLQKKINKLYHYAVKTTTASKAIYFEDIHTSRLKQFKDIMEKMEEVWESIIKLTKVSKNFKSFRLKQLVTLTGDGSIPQEEEPYFEDEDDQSTFSGLLPDISSNLEQFKTYIKWENNIPVPQKGLVEYYDNLQDQLESIKSKLQKYLDSLRYEMNEPNLKFAHTKERYEIQIPEKSEKRRPNNFEFSSKKAGFSRYISPMTKNLVKDLEKTEESLKEQMGLFIGFFFEEFKKKQKIWQRFVEIIGEIDCLISLSEYSFLNQKVRPEFVEGQFEIVAAKHPCLLNIELIPNDIDLKKKTMLLTGPNMGGKSTLLRTTCTLAILAQMGCFVPAESYKCETIDRIFTRIGASDQLEQGKSTFFIEMQETKNVLIHGTSKSLAIIDELGRGTSTFDGLAIAYSVLKSIIENIQCYCLFATHYHILVEEFKGQENISLNMMDSVVREEQIIFLYKLVEGNVSKSFGLNVAKKAGICDQIGSIAEEKADEMNSLIQSKRAIALQNVINFLNS